MIGYLLSFAISASVYIFLCTGAPASVLPVQGKCWYNGTHWGDDRGPATILPLPSCWVAICNNEQSTVTVATPCTAGPDKMHRGKNLTKLIGRHCYPSSRGELPGNQCCGGYLICAHKGWPNNQYFNISNYLKVMFDWQKGEFNYY